MNFKKPIASQFVFGIKDFDFSKEWEAFLKEFPAGGLALFNSPFDSPLNIWKDPEAALEAVYSFTRKARELKIPFICVDQEGGRVRRLRGHFIPLPSAQKISEAHHQKGVSLLKIRKLYELAAEQIALSGIELNFAPVCDLRYPESSNVIGDRSYGSTLKEALPFVETFIGAFRDHHVGTTLKHFPGHGPSKMDSHEEIAVLFKSKEELLRDDFPMFRKSAERAKAIMTAHIAFEDNPDVPFSLDRELLSEFRDLMPKHLFWFTDDLLSMKAVSEMQPWISAFNAEYDFTLLCGTLEKSISAIEDTIRHAEQEVKSFGQEQALEKRVKRIQHFASPPKEILSFEDWKKRLLDLKKQAEPLLNEIEPL